MVVLYAGKKLISCLYYLPGRGEERWGFKVESSCKSNKWTVQRDLLAQLPGLGFTLAHPCMERKNMFFLTMVLGGGKSSEQQGPWFTAQLSSLRGHDQSILRSPTGVMGRNGRLAICLACSPLAWGQGKCFVFMEESFSEWLLRGSDWKLILN